MSLFGLIQKSLAKDEQGPKWQRFTDDEVEVLKQIYSSGLSVKEACSLMNMSAHAIRYHFNRFKAKGIPQVSMETRINILLEYTIGAI